MATQTATKVPKQVIDTIDCEIQELYLAAADAAIAAIDDDYDREKWREAKQAVTKLRATQRVRCLLAPDETIRHPLGANGRSAKPR